MILHLVAMTWSCCAMPFSSKVFAQHAQRHCELCLLENAWDLPWSAQVNLLAEAKSPYVARITCLEVSHSQNLLLCGDAGGSVFAFALPAGSKIWRLAAGPSFNPMPIEAMYHPMLKQCIHWHLHDKSTVQNQQQSTCCSISPACIRVAPIAVAAGSDIFPVAAQYAAGGIIALGHWASIS